LPRNDQIDVLANIDEEANHELEAAAEIADQEDSPIAASRIRSLKWTDNAATPVPIDEVAPLTKAA